MTGSTHPTIDTLASFGICLTPDGFGGLSVGAPAGSLTADILDEVRQHKPSIMAALRSMASQPAHLMAGTLVVPDRVDAVAAGPAIVWTHQTTKLTRWHDPRSGPFDIPAGTPCAIIPRSRLAEHVSHDRREVFEFGQILERNPDKCLVWLDGQVRTLRRNQLALLGR